MENKWVSQQLLLWHQTLDRKLPWKSSKDPYKIWLSEVILQQTRVKQGLPYYLRFVERYPTVQQLADSDDQEVFKLWEGLGYYNRARNMLTTARVIAHEHHGRFPNTYAGLLKLKGIGPYTAAAVGSFAFGLPTAVVDGNVYRVLSRLFDLDTPIDTQKGKSVFQDLAQKLLDPKQPGAHNQAIMDLGATVCTPKSPNCQQCPFQENCLAYASNSIAQRPVKEKRKKKRDRYFQYLFLWHEEHTWIHQRTRKDIWQDLYEFPLWETDTAIEQGDQVLSAFTWLNELDRKNLTEIGRSKLFRQTLSHQIIHSTFWIWELAGTAPSIPPNYLYVARSELKAYPWPRLFNWFFEDQALSLKLP